MTQTSTEAVGTLQRGNDEAEAPHTEFLCVEVGLDSVRGRGIMDNTPGLDQADVLAECLGLELKKRLKTK